MDKLSINFNSTFGPDRLSLSKLLRYVSKNKVSTLEEIMAKTGITNGKTTGKVKPYLYYLSGMGLIDFKFSNDSFTVNVTSFGNIVLEEDAQLGMNLTQWLCHAFMCDENNGSEVWISFFHDWKYGETRDIEKIADNSQIAKSKYTPLLNMYCNEDCFSKFNIIQEDPNERASYFRNSAPCISENIPSYGAFILQLMNDSFRNKNQVCITELESVTCFSNRFGWDSANTWEILNSISSLGYIKINALVDPPCIQPLITPDEAWKKIYSEIY